MSDNQKYYYMRLKEDFFDSDDMILLESKDGDDGYKYSNILLKLYCRSLKYSGRLMYNDRIPFDPNMIAILTRHSVAIVEKALYYFKEMGLIEVLETGAIYISDIQLYIGKSSTEADRIKAYRKQIEQEKSTKVQQLNDTNVQMYNKSTPELELETELEKEIEKEIEKETDVSVLFENYLKIFSEYTKGVKNQPRAKARQVFVQLAPEQRQLALIGAKNYIVWYDKTDQGPYYSKNAFAFLDDMLFMEYQEVPEVSKVGDKKVSKAPEWSNPTYENKTTEEDLAKLEEIRQEALNKLGPQENE